MLRKISLSSLALVAVISTAHAQRPVQGFVILTTGDTVKGELFQTERDNRNQLVHLKRPGQGITTYTAAQVREFGVSGYPSTVTRTYDSQPTPVFLEELLRGPISLYKGFMPVNQDVRYAKDVRYFVQLPDSATPTLLAPQPLALSLHRTLGGCATLDFNQRITPKGNFYTTKFLTAIVQEYAACRSIAPSKVAKSPYQGWRTSWGLTAGFSQSQLTASKGIITSSDQVMNSAAGWQAGITGSLSNWNGFSVQTGVLVVQMKGTINQPVFSGTSLYTINRQATIELLHIQVPVLLRYQIGRGLLRPFLQAGPSFGYEISHSGSITDKRSDQTTSTTFSILWPDRASVGLKATGGVFVALPKGPSFSIEGIYSQGQQGLNTYNFQYRTTGLGASVYF